MSSTVQPALSQPFAAHQQLIQLVASFWKWRRLWIGCTVVFTFLGLAYALLLKSDSWVASQCLVIRDETSATVMQLGRFESQTQMKVAQEMVSEIARNPNVVGQALNKVGRKASLLGFMQTDKPFSTSEIDGFARDNVTIRAPRGAELGTTEIIYLDVKDSSKKRAVELAVAICDAMEKQLQSVRKNRAEGIICELQAALEVSRAELSRSTEILKSIEIEAGSDLADLRGLTDAHSGSTNRLMLDMVRDDIRKCEIELQLHQENLEVTRAALTNDELLVQVTNRLVDTQPTVKKLREGLADATLVTAQLQGRYSKDHPRVAIARTTEQQFKVKLQKELNNATQVLLGSIDLCQRKLEKLSQQELDLGKRLNRLADVRANYTNVMSEVKSNSDEMQQIKRELTQAIAARDASAVSSLVTRVNEPILGDRPVGPGRTTIVGGSLFGGLFLGLGIAFMLIPLDSNLHPQPASQARSEREVLPDMIGHASAWINQIREKGATKFASAIKPRKKTKNNSTVNKVRPKSKGHSVPQGQRNNHSDTRSGETHFAVEVASGKQANRKSPSVFDASGPEVGSQQTIPVSVTPKGLEEVRSIIAEALKVQG